jgi:hypothetical protein
MGTREMSKGLWLANMKVRDHFKETGIQESVIFKVDFKFDEKV